MNIRSGINRIIALILFVSLFSLFPSRSFSSNGAGGNSPFASEPTSPATLLTADLNNCNEVDLSWNSGNGFRRIVVAAQDTAVSGFPVDALSYTGNGVFGNGTNMGNNNYAVYAGTGNNITVTGLNANSHYYFAVFEYNGTGTGTNYLTSTYPEVDTIPFGLGISILVSPPAICVGDTSVFQAHGAVNYLWSPSTALSSTTDSTVRAHPGSTLRYTLSANDGSGCIATERVYLTVNPLPNVSLGSFSGICENGSTLTLSGGSPSGGTYSGTGVSGGIFDPAIAGSGSTAIHYTYTNGQNCTATANSSITVYNPPSVTLSTPSTSCTNSAPFALTGGSPSGGTYSGPGVSGGIFSPSVAGTGSKTIKYVFTDNHGCSDSATSAITVNNPPTVNLSSFVNTCANAPAFTLSGGSPAGGLYSGNGVSAGVFNPAVAGPGTDTIHYTYFNAQGCANTANSTITIYAVPNVSFSALDSICTNSTPVTLSGGSPSGGTYTGPGVSGGVFNPTASGPGTHTMVYSYTNGQGCSSTASSNIQVFAPTTTTFSSPGSRCENAAPLTLSGGNPSGGIYSGAGVSGGVFTPSAVGPGVDTLRYTYTNSHGCIASATTIVTVLSAPIVTIGTFGAVCNNSNSFALTGGSPASGVYFGAGISSGHFNPAVAGAGTRIISYSYTNGQGCSDTASTSIVVNPKPNVAITAMTSVCRNTPSLTLTNGTPTGGIYTGPGVTGNTFNPASADTGTHTITYTYTDSLSCSDSASTPVSVFSLPVVTFSPISSVCENTGPVNLTGGSPSGGVYTGTAVTGGKFYTGIAGAGTFNITYTYTNGNGCSASAIQPILVNVIPHPSLGPDTLVCAGTHVVLSPGSGYTTYSWSTGVSTPTLNIDTTGIGAGIFSYRVTVTNGFGCANRDTIRVTFDICNGIQSLENDIPVCRFYPNPFHQVFSFSTSRSVQLSLYDLTGRMIFQTEVVKGEFTGGENLHAGIYLAEVRVGDERKVFRIIKTD